MTNRQYRQKQHDLGPPGGFVRFSVTKTESYLQTRSITGREQRRVLLVRIRFGQRRKTRSNVSFVRRRGVRGTAKRTGRLRRTDADDNCGNNDPYGLRMIRVQISGKRCTGLARRRGVRHPPARTLCTSSALLREFDVE